VHFKVAGSFGMRFDGCCAYGEMAIVERLK